jgi:hypothetical protein
MEAIYKMNETYAKHQFLESQEQEVQENPL